MKKLQEDKLVPIVIDLSVGKDKIDESFLRMFGAGIELLIKRMFGLNDLNFKFRGSKNALDRLADTLRQETAYMEAYRRAGLNNPSVLKNKWRLQRAVKDFESQTGIKWPLK
jgi:hypothetical protein|tara:strand:+ start:568 stop:903 length:336 start_codon:yes stop_codon:yes gene_type:complete